jgi:hypothetical protein
MVMNYPRRPTLLELYRYDRARALEWVLLYAERGFKPNGHTYGSHNGTAWMWTSARGMRSSCRYGSYKNVPRSYLQGRLYDIEYTDGMVSIHFTDAVHDERRFLTVRFPYV